MNDFTKEELENLYNCIATNRRIDGSQMFPELKDKILVMIDNYCDHEFHLDLSDYPAKLTCTKCGIYYE